MHSMKSFVLAIALACAPVFGQQAETAPVKPPLADRIPNDAILYVGWVGAEALAPAYGGSHLAAVAGPMNLAAMVTQYLPQVVRQLSPDDAQSGKVADNTELARLIWNHPAAFFVRYQAPADPANEAIFEPELVVDAGADAQSLVDLLKKDFSDSNDFRVQTVGMLVVVSAADQAPLPGDDAGTDVAHPLGRSLPFVSAMSKVKGDAAIAVYADARPLLRQADAAVAQPHAADSFAASWEAVRDQLGLRQLDRFAMTAGFDGQDWMSQWALLTVGQRSGLLAAIEPKPADAALLARIPASAASAAVINFDAAGLFDTVVASIPALSDGDPDSKAVQQQIDAANEALGVDIRRDILGRLGSQWAMYGGADPAGTVVLVKSSDAEACASAISTALNNAMAKLPPNIPLHANVAQQTVDGVDCTVIAVPQGQIAFTGKGGFLYIGTPKAVAAAANASDAAAGAQVTQTQAFTTALQRLAVPAVGGFDFADLSQTAPATYQQLNAALTMIKFMTAMRGLPPIPLTLPPLEKILPHLAPSLSVTWGDEHGIYSKCVSPFPGSDYLANPERQVTSVGSVGLLTSILLPSLNRARETANRVKCASDEREIGQAMFLYANDHQGQFPPDLGTLILTEDITPGVFVCPSGRTSLPPNIGAMTKQQQADWVNQHGDYIYVGQGLKNDAPADRVVVYEKENDHGHDGMNILFGDGHVEFVKMDDAKQMIQKAGGAAQP